MTYDSGITTKMMFGIHSVHAPIQIFFQGAGHRNGIDLVSFVGACPSSEILQNQDTAEMWLGDVVFRPHKKFFDVTQNFRGMGLEGALREMIDLDQWGLSHDLLKGGPVDTTKVIIS